MKMRTFDIVHKAKGFLWELNDFLETDVQDTLIWYWNLTPKTATIVKWAISSFGAIAQMGWLFLGWFK